MRIALTGNPNSGKTTVYNALTGKLEAVGNWSGVTVEKVEVKLKPQFGEGTVVDLPGAYSISAYSSEESITTDFIQSAQSDVIVNIVDSTNLSRSLFFTTQLLELNLPVLVVLNKSDILMDEINIETLSKNLGCKVILVSAEKKKNLQEIVTLSQELVGTQNAKTAKTINSETERFAYVDEILKDIYISKADRTQLTQSDKLDKILVSKTAGLPIFIAIMWLVFFISQQGIGGFLSEYINESLFGETIPDTFNELFESMGVSPFLQALIVDGAIGGVGAVLGFLPLIMVLFFLLALLEDCGYMARVAVVMDIFFKKIGLSGKAIIPMVVGTGCAIPGIMATRTIENENERKRLCILTPFIPCGAKLPVIALLAAVFFPESSWIGPMMYVISIATILLVGSILKKVFAGGNENSTFIIELPQYKMPRISYAFGHMMNKGWAFVKKATTIILICNTAVFLLQTFDLGFQVVENADDSMLASFANVLIPLFVPLGLGAWQLVAGAVTGFIAKENVVGTLAVIFAVEEDLLHATDGPLATLSGMTAVTGLAYLVFNLFTPPCFAAIGAMNSEMNDKKWLAMGIGIQLLTGYIFALVINQFGTLFTTGQFATGFVPGLIILAITIGAIIFGMRGKSNVSPSLESVSK